MQGFIHDLRFAMRQFQKNPGFACTALLLVALGTCVSVAIFAFVDAALIKPLPYRDSSRLVGVFDRNENGSRLTTSYLDFVDWKNLNTVFSSIDIYAANAGYTLTTASGSQQVTGTRVSPGFFRTLGVSPVLGRDFRPDEDSPSTPRAVVLSFAAWQKWFGGRADALGKTVVLYGVPNIVIGVLPRDFHFAPAGAAEFWGIARASDYCEQMRGCRNLYAIARLKDGVSLPAALAGMTAVTAQLAKQYPDTDRGQSANIVPLSEVIVGDVRPVLLTLLSGSGLLLLIACTNVASLLLARSDSRKREIAVRGALGAAPARLIRQFATEGLLLVTVGSALGLLSAGWVMRFLIKLIPADTLGTMPYLRGLGLNLHLIIFAGAIVLFVGVLFALTPMLRISLSNLREGLTEGGRGSASTMWKRFGSNLVVLELAVAMVLLVGAGLLGKSLYRLLHEEIGLNPDHLLTLQIEAPVGVDGVALEHQVLDRLAHFPGVKSVGISNALPVSSGWGTAWFALKDRPDRGEHDEAVYRQVSSGYFTTLQARLLRGRYFTAAEDASKLHVAIINRALEKKYFPGEDAIGKQVFFFHQPETTMQIVGIVDDIKEGPLDTGNGPALYVPFSQDPWRGFSIVVRLSQSGPSLLPTLAAVIHGMNREMSVHDEITMTDLIRQSPSAYMHRSSAWLVGSFAVFAFLLSVIGLYGVVAYSVGQRTREIGVRMALGAQRASVYRLILREAAWLTAMGIALGLAGSLGAARLIRGLLFGVPSWDIPTLTAVAAVLTIFSMLASYIPARRAASVNPVEALRAE